MGSKNLKNILMVIVLLSGTQNYIAQTFDMQMIPTNKTTIGLTFNKAHYSYNLDYSTLSGVYNLNINIPVGSGLNITGNIPFVNISIGSKSKYGNYDYSKNGLGNIFIGLQLKPSLTGNRNSFSTIGLFLPTADEHAARNGYLIDYYHFVKYLRNTVCLNYNFAYINLLDGKYQLGFELGPDIFFPTKEENREIELFTHFGVTTGIRLGRLQASTEFVGNAIITEDVDDFGDRFINMLNAGLQYHGSVVTPTIYYKIYFRDQINNIIDGVLGLGINVVVN